MKAEVNHYYLIKKSSWNVPKIVYCASATDFTHNGSLVENQQEIGDYFIDTIFSDDDILNDIGIYKDFVNEYPEYFI